MSGDLGWPFPVQLNFIPFDIHSPSQVLREFAGYHGSRHGYTTMSGEHNGIVTYHDNDTQDVFRHAFVHGTRALEIWSYLRPKGTNHFSEPILDKIDNGFFDTAADNALWWGFANELAAPNSVEQHLEDFWNNGVGVDLAREFAFENRKNMASITNESFAQFLATKINYEPQLFIFDEENDQRIVNISQYNTDYLPENFELSQRIAVFIQTRNLGTELFDKLKPLFPEKYGHRVANGDENGNLTASDGSFDGSEPSSDNEEVISRPIFGENADLLSNNAQSSDLTGYEFNEYRFVQSPNEVTFITVDGTVNVGISVYTKDGQLIGKSVGVGYNEILALTWDFGPEVVLRLYSQEGIAGNYTITATTVPYTGHIPSTEPRTFENEPSDNVSVDTDRPSWGIEYVGTSDGRDKVSLGNGRDLVYLLDGDDELDLGGGHDVAHGGDDDDEIDGGSGNDWIAGEDDEDTIDGGSGDDTLYGGRHDDRIDGEDDEDVIAGEHGDDTLRGGDDDDTIYGGDDDDKIYGEDDDDLLFGEKNEDTIYGGHGRDTIFGGRHDDSIRGGDHNDELLGEDGDDFIDGDDGNDTIFGGDDHDNIEGGDGNDWIAGEDDNDTIDGQAGNDEIYGGRHDDVIDGGSGNDLLIGESGNDSIDGESGVDKLYGDSGNDTLLGGSSGDLLVGGSGQDSLLGESGDDTLVGDAGDDWFDPGSGRDEIYGGDGADTLRLAGKPEDYELRPVSSHTYAINEVTSTSWYDADIFNGIEFIEFGDGEKLSLGEVLLDQYLRSSTVPIGPTSVDNSTSSMDGSNQVGDQTATNQGPSDDAAPLVITQSDGDGTPPDPTQSWQWWQESFDGTLNVDVIDGGTGDDQFLASAGDDHYFGGAGSNQYSIQDGNNGVSLTDITWSYDPYNDVLRGSNDQFGTDFFDSDIGAFWSSTPTPAGDHWLSRDTVISLAGNSVFEYSYSLSAGGTGSQSTFTVFNDGDGDHPDPNQRWQWWDERFWGTAGDDIVNGGSGDDAIVATAGNDHIFGGEGSNQYSIHDGGVAVTDVSWSYDASNDILRGTHELFGTDYFDAAIGAFWSSTASAEGNHWFSRGSVISLTNEKTFNYDQETAPEPNNPSESAKTFVDGDGAPADPNQSWQWWDERFDGPEFAGDEFIYGGAGDDDVVASTGNDIIDGGEGYNQVTLLADVSDFVFSMDPTSGYLASTHATFGYDQYAPGIDFWFETGGWMSHDQVLNLT